MQNEYFYLCIIRFEFHIYITIRFAFYWSDRLFFSRPPAIRSLTSVLTKILSVFVKEILCNRQKYMKPLPSTTNLTVILAET